MKNNKGYSLTELLVAIVIFGIVMLGIAMMMRTSSISYSDGNAYVTMQTEAQVISNQIEEILVDATEYAGSGTISVDNLGNNNVYYTIKSGGKTHYIMHSADKDKIYYQSGDSVDNDADSWQLMADYVEYFQIDGFETDETSPDYDNMVTLHVEMNKRGYKYSSAKDVYFRNAIENPSVQEIAGGSGSDDEDSEGITGIIVLDRYDIIDLERLYDIKPSTITYSAGFNSNYKFVDTTYDNSEVTVTGKDKIYGSCDYTEEDENGVPAVSQFITPNTTINTDFGESVDESDDAWIAGTTYSNTPVKYLVTTPSVTYTVSGKDGFAIFSKENADATGRDNWIRLDGINYASMLDYPIGADAKSLQYALVLYYDNDGDEKYNPSGGSAQKVGNNAPSPKTGNSKITESATLIKCSGQMEPQMDFYVKVDPMTGDLSVTAGEATAASLTTFNTGKVRLAIMILAPGEDPYVVDVPVYIQAKATATDGLNISAFEGGNTYEATAAQWGITWAP